MDESDPSANKDTLDLQSGEDVSAYIHSFWLKFKLTNEIYNAEIVDAKLWIWCTAKEGYIGDPGFEAALTLFRTVRDVVEDEATWNIAKTGTSWAAPGGRGGNFGAEDDGGLDIDADYEAYGTIPNINTWYVIDVNTNGLVQSWVDRSRKEYGIMFLMESATTDYMVTFTDSEGTDGKRPYLVLQYRGGESYSSSSRSVSSSSCRSSSSRSSSSSCRSSSSSSQSASSVSESGASVSASSVSESSSSASEASSSSSCRSSSCSSSKSSSLSLSSSSKSSSSMSVSSSFSVSYYKKRLIGYICCQKLSKVEYDLLKDDDVDVDYESARITTWIKKDDVHTIRNRAKATISKWYSPSYPTHRACWGDTSGASIWALRTSTGTQSEWRMVGDPPRLRQYQVPRDLDLWPKIYWHNPLHCQWWKTEVMLHTKLPYDYTYGDLWFTQNPTGGQEIKEDKADVIAGDGGPHEREMVNNQIVPGMKVALWWHFWDGGAYYYVEEVAHTYYNTKFLTGAVINKVNTNRYGSGEDEMYLPAVWVWCNGKSVPAWGCGWIDWELNDWIFTTIRPIGKDPTRWNQDDRIDEDDVEKMISDKDNTYEDHLAILPLRIGNYGD